MDNSILQAATWIAAGAVLLVYFKRRRARKAGE